MKLHYSEILLFSLLLNILEHNKTKPYNTTHTSTTTSRVLIECNIYMPNYDNDPDMNSVKENFHKQTEQRFHENDKRMIKNRQKCKEKCDKEIQKIIVKDKIKKSLAEKVEKGCLKCGCGLGGVATSVGVLGTAVVNEMKRTAMFAAIDAAIVQGAAEGSAQGAAAGINTLIQGINTEFGVESIAEKALTSYITAQNYNNVSVISGYIYNEYKFSLCNSIRPLTVPEKSICTFMSRKTLVQWGSVSELDVIKTSVKPIIESAEKVAADATKTTTERVVLSLTAKNTGEVNATYAIYQNAIIASVTAILIIVLVMVMIYLILRYRRKKRMNKKLQYTKLLKQ
ncbi:PIR protein, putative [Plasmodium sp. gorilla clade G1]|nr:PIR protein, putative [Plasmodium sp. gorilla clade G1]